MVKVVEEVVGVKEAMNMDFLWELWIFCKKDPPNQGKDRGNIDFYNLTNNTPLIIF